MEGRRAIKYQASHNSREPRKTAYVLDKYADCIIRDEYDGQESLRVDFDFYKLCCIQEVLSNESIKEHPWVQLGQIQTIMVSREEEDSIIE